MSYDYDYDIPGCDECRQWEHQIKNVKDIFKDVVEIIYGDEYLGDDELAKLDKLMGELADNIGVDLDERRPQITRRGFYFDLADQVING